MKFIITVDSTFNAGWFAYLLGLDEPVPSDDEAAKDAFDMAADTPSMATIRDVLQSMSYLNQASVEVVEEER